MNTDINPMERIWKLQSMVGSAKMRRTWSPRLGSVCTNVNRALLAQHVVSHSAEHQGGGIHTVLLVDHADHADPQRYPRGDKTIPLTPPFLHHHGVLQSTNVCCVEQDNVE